MRLNTLLLKYSLARFLNGFFFVKVQKKESYLFDCQFIDFIGFTLRINSDQYKRLCHQMGRTINIKELSDLCAKYKWNWIELSFQHLLHCWTRSSCFCLVLSNLNIYIRRITKWIWFTLDTDLRILILWLNVIRFEKIDEVASTSFSTFSLSHSLFLILFLCFYWLCTHSGCPLPKHMARR